MAAVWEEKTALVAVFSCLDESASWSKRQKRTAVYIDGYNLYYGRLRRTDFKWLDVVQLFASILRVQDPLAQLDKVRYLSAPALGRFASHGNEST